MIAFVRLAQFLKLSVLPVKPAGVHNDAAHLHGMAVHVFGLSLIHI